MFFEGTPFSVGRGTHKQFQVIGHPDYPDHAFQFVPHSTEGALNPPYKDKACYGIDLSHLDVDSLFRTRKMNLSLIFKFLEVTDTTKFFTEDWFDKLAGGPPFRNAIESGLTEEQIRASWSLDLAKFNERRKRYLLYKDFE